MNTIPSPQTLRYKIQLFFVWSYWGRKHLPTRALHWHLKELALTSCKHHLVCWSALFWGNSVHRTHHSSLSGLRTQIVLNKVHIKSWKTHWHYNYVIFFSLSKKQALKKSHFNSPSVEGGWNNLFLVSSLLKSEWPFSYFHFVHFEFVSNALTRNHGNWEILERNDKLDSFHGRLGKFFFVKVYFDFGIIEK